MEGKGSRARCSCACHASPAPSRAMQVRRFDALGVQKLVQQGAMAVVTGLFWFQRGADTGLQAELDIVGLLFFMLLFPVRAPCALWGGCMALHGCMRCANGCSLWHALHKKCPARLLLSLHHTAPHSPAYPPPPAPAPQVFGALFAALFTFPADYRMLLKERAGGM